MRSYNKLVIEYIEDYSKKRINQTSNSIAHICSMSNISEVDLIRLVDDISTKARIGIHFHPYRLNSQFKSVLELLIESGLYKNQFETKISNGSLTAFKGGKRDQWENVLFNDLFSSNEIAISDRPKYGALDLLGHSDGPSPRFGSCYFLLKPKLTEYATFTYMDSYINPKEKGTIRYFDEILSCLLLECFERDYALGERNIRPHQLIKKISAYLNADFSSLELQVPTRNLNHYIEAQIHTPIVLKNDVDVLVADLAYKNTRYEEILNVLCDKYLIELKWNEGFELEVANVPDHFRGASMPELAQQIAIDNKINAYIIGEAEKSFMKKMADASAEQISSKLQELKYLWHVLVKYGNSLKRRTI